ncbi:hypothetical protein KCH_13030 [Kitasatospora cheerisanensis KCTC 2395]|uniref:Uncharacterized protein n=1 Tax=Kitasatospora cheerisanensis KCTC 2395 TaxID=1348663 RepID=A0A066Z032_9ACTN|nr:hypothetical protein KCH_13030 [Kitasatospora cheerisanensis KCTC 2395]
MPVGHGGGSSPYSAGGAVARSGGDRAKASPLRPYRGRRARIKTY